MRAGQWRRSVLLRTDFLYARNAHDILFRATMIPGADHSRLVLNW
jgi:hypothetical protein